MFHVTEFALYLSPAVRMEAYHDGTLEIRTHGGYGPTIKGLRVEYFNRLRFGRQHAAAARSLWSLFLVAVRLSLCTDDEGPILASPDIVEDEAAILFAKPGDRIASPGGAPDLCWEFMPTQLYHDLVAAIQREANLGGVAEYEIVTRHGWPILSAGV